MSKRLIALSLAVALLCCACPMIAFAANETTGETDVFVTFSGFGDGDEPNETGPTRDEPDVRGYEINIPASYSTNEAPFMAITANFVSVGVGKRVTVSIDGAKTFINGEPFTLANMADPSRKVICGLYRSNNGSIGEWMPPPDDAVVAIFENGNTAPVSYGYIVASASADDNTIDGTYKGTVHFKIAIVDE